MASNSDLVKLAQKLTADGPHKMQSTPRRVRGLLNGKYAFDTINAYHVWEHPYYPQFYVPVSSFTPDAKITKASPVDGTNGATHLGRLSVGDKSTERVLMFSSGSLKDLVKVEFKEMDQWFEEDVPIYQHPKDPYKRIDILNSTRPVKVALDGVTLAESPNPLFLLETSLRTRYYLPPTSVKWEYLSKSDSETYCPYKGRANYYNVTINGKEHKDLVWYYRYPTAESAPVAGHLCFYNEKVNIWVDGVMEQI
ncbi:DUF427-domain-containing protein [Trematosphaeria pertusa]|uniref:DUF427-domain-containing protein n=1 Tax=Trematosphaeria pertusa TaxID=390896 RepID=A0A6A6IK78_9PLEO|nr:DUF427-domain-containing protein [Trematosphaeria pertusa]KAF2251005.1 DUF427-domain-containing protein [Trematosphaeria pertusa]